MPEGFHRGSTPDCLVEGNLYYVATPARKKVCNAHNATIFLADLIADRVSDFESEITGRRSAEKSFHDAGSVP